jgi:predicted TIM-barrel enzyme
MSGHGSTCGLMAYGDANAVAMEIGEYEVLPVVEEVPVICGVQGAVKGSVNGIVIFHQGLACSGGKQNASDAQVQLFGYPPVR